MSLEHSPARQGRQRRSRVDVATAAYSIRKFCDSHDVSRSALYKLWRQRIGPKFFRVGNQIRISAEAAAEWRAAREAAAAEALKQADEDEDPEEAKGAHREVSAFLIPVSPSAAKANGSTTCSINRLPLPRKL
jgi:hypothetical protein